MAGYREHISVSGLCGLCYGAMATFGLGFTGVQGALAGLLTWVGGMLPDLDSESGRPVRELFPLVAAIAPMLMIRHLARWSGSTDGTILLAVICYGVIRYGGAALLHNVSVHRGMFHSIPAMIISAELIFLAFTSSPVPVRLLMAGGVALGFLSHLILDEMYSVEWTGIRLRLNKSAGSAMKFVGRNLFANVFTYALLMLLTYSILVDQGILRAPEEVDPPRRWFQAAEPLPEFR